MAISHGFRRALDLDFHGSAKTFAFMHCHDPNSLQGLLTRERNAPRDVVRFLTFKGGQLNDRASALLDSPSGIQKIL